MPRYYYSGKTFLVVLLGLVNVESAHLDRTESHHSCGTHRQCCDYFDSCMVSTFCKNSCPVNFFAIYLLECACMSKKLKSLILIGDDNDRHINRNSRDNFNVALMIFFCMKYVLSAFNFRYSQDAKQEAHKWECGFCAVGFFIYQTLDGIDGKQARRTGTANPLGELFDHGCDAISIVLLAVALCIGFQAGDIPEVMLISVGKITAALRTDRNKFNFSVFLV